LVLLQRKIDGVLFARGFATLAVVVVRVLEKLGNEMVEEKHGRGLRFGAVRGLPFGDGTVAMIPGIRKERRNDGVRPASTLRFFAFRVHLLSLKSASEQRPNSNRFLNTHFTL